MGAARNHGRSGACRGAAGPRAEDGLAWRPAVGVRVAAPGLVAARVAALVAGAAWFDLDGRRVGDLVDLGAAKVAPIVRTEWTRRPGGGLVGTTLWVPSRDPRVTRRDDWHRWWMPRPGTGEARFERLDDRFVGEAMWGVPGRGGGRFGVYIDAPWSTVWVQDEPVSALTEEETGCPGWSFGTFLVDGDLIAFRLQIVDCASNRDRTDRLDFRNGTPRLFDPGDGTLGVLLRIEQSRPAGPARESPRGTGIELHLVYANIDGSVMMPPKRIGMGQAGGLSLDDGRLARITRVPGGYLVMDRDAFVGVNGCHRLLWGSRDGECVDDAPWPLPCMRRRDPEASVGEGDCRTHWVEFVEVPGAAVLVWRQFRNAGLFVTRDDPGKRASTRCCRPPRASARERSCG